MRHYVNYIITIFMFLHWGQLYAQNEEREFNIGFRVNEFHVVPTFADNKKEIDSLLLFLHRIQTDSAQYFINVIFRGAASPEGSFQLNKMLSLQRMNALEKIVRGKIDISETMVERDDSYIPWDHLKSRVEKVNMPYKDSVISILDNEPILVEYNNGKLIDQRIVKLREIENGKVWLQLFKNYFGDMRNASVKFIMQRIANIPNCKLPALPFPALCNIDRNRERKIPYPLISPEPLKILVCPEWTRHIYLKTNFVGLALLNANISGEIDIAKHWSFNLPIYYSGCNYFKSTIKFRTFSIQPEVRYWPSGWNDSWFVGTHLGVSYYNFAFNGAYRYQDHNGRSPSIGGGLCLGYRMPLSGDNKWKIEFSAGAGVYPIHYDIFRNTPSTKNGLLVDTKRKTYFGLDQASISLAYTFDLKTGGKR
ncbi:MAG: DUF3575 domain-containing protein [Bacteroidaceae bacterium]|nr:DUF3575 domain-containing protein [Bacteroidaceae bacterium]